jgi:2-polyprenyl-6-methoxyphenol hydroxylase-like FAD-dependent oxidoreductase
VNQSDVLIVGAGPAGLVTGISLARYGVKTLLVEKRTAISTLSRATVISTRSMEIFRSWGLEDAVRAGAAAGPPSTVTALRTMKSETALKLQSSPPAWPLLSGVEAIRVRVRR